MRKNKVASALKQNEILDLKNNIYSLTLRDQNADKKIYLNKKTTGGEEIWKKEIVNYNTAKRILGVDGDSKSLCHNGRAYKNS